MSTSSEPTISELLRITPTEEKARTMPKRQYRNDPDMDFNYGALIRERIGFADALETSLKQLAEAAARLVDPYTQGSPEEALCNDIKEAHKAIRADIKDLERRLGLFMARPRR